jgi:hypothetical protein
MFKFVTDCKFSGSYGMAESLANGQADTITVLNGLCFRYTSKYMITTIMLSLSSKSVCLHGRYFLRFNEIRTA